MKVVGISGSLRSRSWNTQLLETVLRMIPADVETSWMTPGDLPLFNEDLEADPPAAVLDFQARVDAAGGIIVCTPEYNLGMPGVLKNAFDWLSRPPAQQLPKLQGKPVLLMGTSPGPYGTISAQNGAVQMFRALRMPLCPGFLAIPSAHESFRDGKLQNDNLRARLQTQIDLFLTMLADEED